jgi:2-(1,2-epoxy-1,2-dihydrophenyl)acetyl-CoA isomerase
MADSVLYEVTAGLATITLNRPEAMNSLDTGTKVALHEVIKETAADPGVRAVLLTGTGRAFCAGQDLKEHLGSLPPLGGADGTPDHQDGRKPVSTVEEHYNPIVTAIATMPKPVVAGVNGVAAGAGAGLAFAADYRVVADTASFTTAFAAVGLTADTGVSWTLPRLVGWGRATDLLFFPRQIRAAEALELGIAQQVVPAEELADTARQIAGRLAEGPTVAYATLKESLAYATTHSLMETLVKEDELQQLAAVSQDHRAAVEAFLNKERPRYQGR